MYIVTSVEESYFMFLLEDYSIIIWGIGTLVFAVLLHWFLFHAPSEGQCQSKETVFEDKEEPVLNYPTVIFESKVEPEVYQRVPSVRFDAQVHEKVDDTIEVKVSDTMDQWTRIKETLQRDRARADKAINWLKNIVAKKSEPTQDGGQSKRKREPVVVPTGPVLHTVTYQTKSMVWNRYYWSKPIKKRYQKFSHRSNQNQLPHVWHSALLKFSDRHPILYNGTLWTSTRGAKQRLQKQRKPRGPLSILTKLRNRKRRKCKLVLETLHVESAFPRHPHLRSFYTIEKETLEEINAKSRAQWRR